ncbi:MAG: M15 family metallopeptidase [Lachnospiraceae bacterium]|nr:M15 family metallopeptidase [Lachnospiraceae bacterium]
MARDIRKLHPELQEKIARLKALCAAEGLPLGIGECVRTAAEQDALYAQGRTKPGSIVTNARGSSYASQHQWGIAFDFYKNVSGHAYDDIPFFNRVGALAKSIGLAWGGDWTSPVDRPHLYLPYWGDTPAPLKKQYGNPAAFFASWGTSGGGAGTQISGKLTVDGYWGAATTRRLQQIFDTPADGIVSHQYVGWRDKNPGISGSFQWEENPRNGSALIRAIQKKVGVTADGFLGPETIRGMQKWMGTEADGYFSGPSACIRALQRWCNDQA